jgi:hypothetical protein
MASSDSGAQNGSVKEVEKKAGPVEPLRLPSVEEIRGQDIWNNCVVRSVVSGVMGSCFDSLSSFKITFTSCSRVSFCKQILGFHLPNRLV